MSEGMGLRKSFLTMFCATPVKGKFKREKCFAQFRAEKMNPILAETEVAIFELSADFPALVRIGAGLPCIICVLSHTPQLEVSLPLFFPRVANVLFAFCSRSGLVGREVRVLLAGRSLALVRLGEVSFRICRRMKLCARECEEFHVG